MNITLKLSNLYNLDDPIQLYWTDCMCDCWHGRSI